MFGGIARRYDLANRVLSGGTDALWRRRLAREVLARRPSTVIDLATGSGDVAFALRRKLPTRTKVIGIDFCQPMLDEAKRKQKADKQLANVDFQHGDILSLPLEDASADVLTIAFGLRNIADRDKGLREMMRLLRPGGSLFVLEFTQPARIPRPFYFFYLRKILPPLAGRLFGNRDAYEYLNNTIITFPDMKALTEEILDAGFAEARATGLTWSIVALHHARKLGDHHATA